MTIQTNRISTFTLHQRTLNDFTRVQSNLFDLQGQISSGLKSQDFEGLNGDVEEFTGLESKLKRLNNYFNSNTEAISRLKTMGSAMDNMVDIVDDIKNLIGSRNGANEDDLAFEQQIKDMRLSVSRELNTTLQGRFLFGGTNTSEAPVIDDPVPESVTTGVPDDVYYKGSKDDFILRAQENVEKKYGVRADDPAFQKIYAGMSMALEGHAEDDDAKVGRAFTLVSEGLDQLIALKARVDADYVDLNNINDRHQSSITYFKGVAEAISKSDPVAASTQVAVDQSILQATFQVFARISSLKLSDFLT
ncbi:MAG: hypothetical protein U1E36_04065 [Rickettsiales bacterium]